MELKVKQIKKSFGDNNVLKGIDISAKSGKAVGILGRNGAGKTTTIRIIMGVFGADSGEVLIDDKPIDRKKVQIGYLPEERGLYPKKKILEQLVYFAALKDMSRKEAVVAADYWLGRLLMTEYRMRRLDTLSKGNQQKIQLVATLISNPDIIILDEPFSGLDPVNAMLLKDIVKELIAKGKIVLFSSHQMSYIEEFCDEIVILNRGQIVLGGSIKEIKRGYDRSRIIIQSKDAHEIEKGIDEQCEFDGEKLVVRLKTPEDKAKLISKLAHGGYDIDEIKVYEPSLNDIFVEYTEDSI